jgi:hypothetical protein
MHDPIKYLLWAGAAGLVTALGCGIYIVWSNAESRNLALGLGAVVGSCVIFIVQIFFELRGTTTVTDFPVEFTIDYKTKSIRSPRAFNAQAFADYRNIFVEGLASTAISIASPPLTQDDAKKIANDMAVLTVINYILDEQFDWQIDAINYKTSSGTISLSQPLSKSNECTHIDARLLREKLKAAGNIFAKLEQLGMRSDFCLPPHSKIEITRDSITLKNFVCQISFAIRSGFSSETSQDPHNTFNSKTTQMPLLADGSAQYRTVIIGGRATVMYTALRAQDRELAKYKRWTERMVAGVASRFVLPEITGSR